MPASYPLQGCRAKNGRLAVRLCALAALGLLSGCASIPYYSQAIGGELSLLVDSRPITRILQDPRTSAPLRTRLQQVVALRHFARTALYLPVGHSFTRYTARPGPYLVWNVFAARPLSIHLHTWCFPVAGCVPYRGYFRRSRAQAYARREARRGYDVYVGGAPLYSTLGWLPDPVPGTLDAYSPTTVAALLFHELAHALLYVPGDARFNESFAVTVQEVSVQRWLSYRHDAAAETRFQQEWEDSLRFGDRVQALRVRLRGLYQGPGGRSYKLQEKDRLLRQAARSLQYPPGSALPPPNNAELGALATYTRFVPAFQCLLARSGGHLRLFYARSKALAQEVPDARHADLAAMCAGLPSPLPQGPDSTQRPAGRGPAAHDPPPRAPSGVGL